MIAARLFTLLLALVVLIAPAASQQAPVPPSITDLASANEALDAAHMAFERGDFDQAEGLYVQTARSGYGLSHIWTNAGTAAFRAGDTGRAVLYYARALWLDPQNEAARRSLEVISPATNDGDAGSAGDVAANLLRRTNPFLWVVLAQICFLIVCYGVFRLISAPERDERGHWLAVLGWTAAFTAVFAILAGTVYDLRTASDQAVVLTEGATSRSAPTVDAMEELILPAGTIIELTEAPRRGFVRFRLADGNTGYISTDDVERI